MSERTHKCTNPSDTNGEMSQSGNDEGDSFDTVPEEATPRRPDSPRPRLARQYNNLFSPREARRYICKQYVSRRQRLVTGPSSPRTKDPYETRRSQIKSELNSDTNDDDDNDDDFSDTLQSMFQDSSDEVHDLNGSLETENDITMARKLIGTKKLPELNTKAHDMRSELTRVFDEYQNVFEMNRFRTGNQLSTEDVQLMVLLC